MTYGSLNNLMLSNAESNTPEVGMGATQVWWTDRKAFTIVKVSADGKTVWATRDIVTRTDAGGPNNAQRYEFETDWDGETDVYTLRKDGRWIRKGMSMKNGQVLSIGVRREFYDYGF